MYPMKIPPKNTENTTTNNRYVIKSTDPLARNDDQKIDPTNKNTPNITNENIIRGKLVLSAKLSKNPLGASSFSVKLYPHSVQNSISSSLITLPQLGQCLTISI